jgi:hypothetical protein
MRDGDIRTCIDNNALLELKKRQKEKEKFFLPKAGTYSSVGYIIILITTSQTLIGNTNTSYLYRLVVEQIAPKKAMHSWKKKNRMLSLLGI